MSRPPEDRTIRIARLFAPPARWGYERIDPSPPAEPDVELGARPERAPVGKIARPQATGLRAATILVTVGAILVLTLDSSLRAFTFASAHGLAKLLAFALVSLVGASLVYRFTFVWQHGSAGWRAAHGGAEHLSDSLSATADALRDPRRALKAILSHPIPVVGALIGFLLPSLTLMALAVIGWVRVWQTGECLVPDPREERRVEEGHRVATNAWQKEAERFKADESARVQSADVWYPVLVSTTAPTTLVFGGTGESWRAALATVCGSLLAERRRVLICNLSRRPQVTQQLSGLARDAGFVSREALFPEIELALHDRQASQGGAASLTVLGIEDHAGEPDAVRSANLLCGRLLCDGDRGACDDALIILGADRVAKDRLRSLLDHTTRRHGASVDATTAAGISHAPATLVFFEHFRPGDIELAGAGGVAVAFLRLVTREEATNASRFIGAANKFVLAGHTHATGRSLTHTEGTEATTSASVRFGPSLPSAELLTSHSHLRSEAVGRTDERAATFQRVREPHYEPETLMQLPNTGMVYVETLADGRRPIVELDCDPTITSEAKIAGPSPMPAAQPKRL